MAYQVLLPTSDGKYLLNVHTNVDAREVIEAEGLASVFDVSLLPGRPKGQQVSRPDYEVESPGRSIDEAL